MPKRTTIRQKMAVIIAPPSKEKRLCKTFSLPARVAHRTQKFATNAKIFNGTLRKPKAEKILPEREEIRRIT